MAMRIVGFLTKGKYDPLFWLTAGVLGVFLLCVLAIQVRD